MTSQLPRSQWPFPKKLQQLLEEKGLRASTFDDKRYGIPDGTVRAWKRGSTIPSHTNIHLPKIAKALDISLDILERDIKESKALEKKEKNHNKSSNSDKMKLLHPSKETGDSLEIGDYRDDIVIKGQTKLGDTFISCLEDAKSQSIPKYKKRICLTFFGEKSVFDSEARQARWHNALAECVKNGWSLDHIIRLKRGGWERTIELVKTILKLAGQKGDYNPYILRKSTVKPTYGIFSISDYEGFMTYGLEQDEATDTGMYLHVDQSKGKEKIEDILIKYFERHKSLAEPLYQEFKKYGDDDFYNIIRQADIETGDTTVILRRLSEITRPHDWYESNSRWAQALGKYYNLHGEALEEHLYKRKERRIKLENRLLHTKCRYIYPIDCIESFVHNISSYDSFYFKASTQERLEQIRELKRLVDNFPNYEMAIVDDPDNLIRGMHPIFCEVHDRAFVLMEVRDFKKRASKNDSKWIFISDDIVANAFYVYFSRIWEKHIPDRCKERAETLRHLEKWISRLEFELQNSY